MGWYFLNGFRSLGTVAFPIYAVALWLVLSPPLLAEPKSKLCILDGTDYDYWLYVPTGAPKGSEFPLLISVHAIKATGKDMCPMFEKFADKEKFMLLCPTFTSKDYPKLLEGEDDVLIRIIKEVSSTYRIRNSKAFIAGIAGGADFALKFALRHSEFIAGASLHSLTYVPGTISREAKRFSIVITAGEKDQLSFERSARAAQKLRKARFPISWTRYPDIGMSWNTDAQIKCRSLFLEVTTGLSLSLRESIENNLKKAENLIGEEKFAQAVKILASVHASDRKSGAYQEQTHEILKEINQEGFQRLKTYQEALKDDPDVLLEELRNLSTQFKGAEINRRIRKTIAELSRKKEVETKPKKKKPAPSSNDRRAKSLLNNAKILADAGNKVAARRTLKRLLENYPASQHAEDARKLLKQIGEE
mgnify:FL=1